MGQKKKTQRKVTTVAERKGMWNVPEETEKREKLEEKVKKNRSK